MDLSIAWLHDIYSKYVSLNSKKPISISDWHNEDESILKIPWDIISNSFLQSKKQATKYLFLDSNDENKYYVKEYLKNIHNLDIQNFNFTITQNATVALYLIIKAITYSFKKTRFLVFTPTYFSIFNNLNILKNTTIFYHLSSRDDFKINLDNFRNLIRDQFIDVIIISDPIFCTGMEWSHSILVEIIQIAKDFDCWIIFDHTIGGMKWNSNKKYLLNKSKLQLFLKSKKSVFIDSPTKKLFLNGLKHALIFGDEQIINQVEIDADNSTGTFSTEQLSIFPQLYDPINQNEIEFILHQNIELFESNYNLIKNLINSENFFLAETNSGFHTILFFKNYYLKSCDIKKITRKLLLNHGIYAIPITHFGFFKSNHLGFRVNLSKHPKALIDGVSTIIDKELDLFQ